jgi:transposase-like protein
MENKTHLKLKAIDNSAPELGALEGARRATGKAPGSGGGRLSADNVPDPEVAEQKTRRYFTAKYKLRILQEADNCTESGQIGSLLRREGLYFSNLTTWRRQRDKGLLTALSPKKRGRKKQPRNPLAEKVTKLEKENQRLLLKLKQADTIIEVQKKVSEILGISQNLSKEND